MTFLLLRMISNRRVKTRATAGFPCLRKNKFQGPKSKFSRNETASAVAAVTQNRS